MLQTEPLGADKGREAETELISATTSTPSGWVFTTQKPLLLKGPEQEWRFPMPIALGQGAMKSGCWLPLIGRKGVVGTLNIFSQRAGAFSEDDLSALGQLANQAAIALENAMAFRQISEQKEKLTEEKLYLEDALRTEFNFEEIVGGSRSLQQVLRQIENVAPTDSTVLILGETGTGKEMLARSVHNLSPRRERTIVRVNCSSITAGLLESELFGNQKGAFTGAIARRIGRVELAHQGTLFLDEVGEIPGWSCSQSCCASCRSESLNGSAAPIPLRVIHGSSRPPTAISGKWLLPENFAVICTIG